MVIMYLVMGVHPRVPGSPRSLWFSKAGADGAAAELVNILMEDYPLDPPEVATAADWQDKLDALHDAHEMDESDCDVWVEDLATGDAPAAIAPAAVAPAAEDDDEERTFCDRCGCWRGASNGWGWNNEAAPAAEDENQADG